MNKSTNRNQNRSDLLPAKVCMPVLRPFRAERYVVAIFEGLAPVWVLVSVAPVQHQDPRGPPRGIPERPRRSPEESQSVLKDLKDFKDSNLRIRFDIFAILEK